jgi:hypothetical protein
MMSQRPRRMRTWARGQREGAEVVDGKPAREIGAVEDRSEEESSGMSCVVLMVRVGMQAGGAA